MAEHQSLFNARLVEAVLDLVADGIPLAKLCREEGIPHDSDLARVLDSGVRMPKVRTFYDWVAADEALAARFARAREAGCDVIAAGVLDIADDSRNDFIASLPTEDDEKPVMSYNAEHVQRSKLRCEMRLKLLACWDAGRYGPNMKAQVQHSGEVNGTFVLNVHDTPKPKP